MCSPEDQELFNRDSKKGHKFKEQYVRKFQIKVREKVERKGGREGGRGEGREREHNMQYCCGLCNVGVHQVHNTQ